MPVIINKRQFIIGLVLLFSFGVTLAVILSPVFHGTTGLHMVDGIFNSLAKGSSYFIPDLAKETGSFAGTRLEVTLQPKSADELEKTRVIFTAAGAQVVAAGPGSLQVSGDLGVVAKSALADADRLFQAGKEAGANRYGFSDREAVYCWWVAFKQINKGYLHANQAAEAVFTEKIIKKGLEPAYNYAGIAPARFSELAGISTGSLVFYVIYTIWYGFAIMMIFEGLGITANKPVKKAEA